MSEFVEIPATEKSTSHRRLIHGVGFNDADYIVQPKIHGKTKICPYYRLWKSIITRCYSKSFHRNNPSYEDCSVCADWLVFSNFRKWMKTKDWQGKQLDKDLKVDGNRVYGPEFCVFVSAEINNLLLSHDTNKGEYMKGVTLNKSSNRYVASSKYRGERKNIGSFSSEKEAGSAYLSYKAGIVEKEMSSRECSENKELIAILEYYKAKLMRLSISE